MNSDGEWRELLAGQVRLHARLWFKLAVGVLRDAHAAEDVCQQALLRAWERRDQLRDPALLKAWMARTVVNESLAVLRRRGVERRAMEKHHRNGVEPAPQEMLGEREAVVLGLEKLPETTRAVVPA